MATLSQTRLNDIAVAAGTLFERLNAAAPAGDLEPTRAAVAALLSWKKVSCGLDDEAFRRRLSWDGLAEEHVLRALSAPFELAALPRWTRWLNLILDEAAALCAELERGRPALEMESLGDQAPPFVEIWIPFLRAARRTLTSEHEVATGGWRPAALAALEQQLLLEIGVAGSVTLYQEFSSYREASGEEGVYRRFVGEVLGSGFPGFFIRHPALCRQLTRLAEAWTQGAAELLARLRGDRRAIAQAFSRGEDPGDVTWVRPGLSERHDGRRVLALGFESGLRVVYKPRDIGLEGAFQRFLDWCRAHELESSPATIRLLPREGYGWAEYIEPGDLGQVDPRRYFQRAGSLLCLSWFLGGRDLHMENVVATKDGPVLVDAETMLQPEVRSPLSGAAESRSCLSTGLLVLLAADPEGGLHDTGGLRGRGGLLAPVAERDWLDLGLDTVRFEERVHRLPDSPNRLVVADRELRPEAFGSEILDGFTRAYRFLFEHREAIQGEGGPLDVFVPHRGRVLLRDSKHYALLLHTLAEPDYATDGLRRSLILEALNRPHSLAREKPALWPLVADEREAMERADVPRFTLATTGTALVSASGQLVDRLFARSGLEAARDRLTALDEDDLLRQKTWLRDALANPADAVLVCAPPAYEPMEAADASGALLESARWIGHELLARAQEKEGALLWTYPGHADPLSEDLGPTDLYDGAAGVVLFLAALAHATGEAGWGDAARAASAPVRRALLRVGTADDEATLRVGACHGLGSLLYSACWISRLLEDGALVDVAVETTRRLPAGFLRSTRGCDVNSGSAGAVLGFLTLFHHSGAAWALEAARQGGQHLLEHRVVTRGGATAWPADDRRLLAGFAHGAAGIAYALARLFAETGERELLEAAAGAHRYERQLFSAEQANWPILESQAGEGEQSIHAWCHGAPGIGLARAAGFDVLGGESVLQEIRVGAAAAARPKLSRADHLCCGNLGRADAVLTIGRRLGDEDLVQRAVDLAARVARRASERRRFGLPSSPHTHYVFIPGFFRGMAGIGYQLLRTASPTRFPSVLAFESDTVASRMREMACNTQSI